MGEYENEAEWRKDFWIFFVSMLRHWLWWTGTTISGGIAALWQGGGRVIPGWVLSSFALFGFVIAAFLSFRDQRRIVESKNARISELESDLNRRANTSGQLAEAVKSLTEAQPKRLGGTTPQASPPYVGKTNAELEREKQVRGKQDRMAEALARLVDQRDNTIKTGPEHYVWGPGGDDFYRMAVEFATEVVRECFGNLDAEQFRSDAGFPRAPSGENYAQYRQILMNLEQYQIKIIELSKRL